MLFQALEEMLQDLSDRFLKHIFQKKSAKSNVSTLNGNVHQTSGHSVPYFLFLKIIRVV